MVFYTTMMMISICFMVLGRYMYNLDKEEFKDYEDLYRCFEKNLYKETANLYKKSACAWYASVWVWATCFFINLMFFIKHLFLS